MEESSASHYCILGLKGPTLGERICSRTVEKDCTVSVRSEIAHRSSQEKGLMGLAAQRTRGYPSFSPTLIVILKQTHDDDSGSVKAYTVPPRELT